jgi:hypothetical protein
MNNEILKKRFLKLNKQYLALKDYKNAIDNLLLEKNIFDQFTFNTLEITEKALLDAYLKRFSSLQDFLGSKIFGSILKLASYTNIKMNEILYNCEKEQIIDDINIWIELREIRNDLEHDYPEELQEALDGLKYCIEHFENLEKYYLNSLEFASNYIKDLDAIIK